MAIMRPGEFAITDKAIEIATTISENREIKMYFLAL